MAEDIVSRANYAEENVLAKESQTWLASIQIKWN